MMERKYLEDLNPEDHGFTKEDYNKKIYVGEYMQGGYSTINEILTFFKKYIVQLLELNICTFLIQLKRNGLENGWKKKKIN